MPKLFSWKKKPRKRKSYQACKGYGIPIEQCKKLTLGKQELKSYICPVCDEVVEAKRFIPKPTLFRLIKRFVLSLPPEKPYLSLIRHKDKRAERQARQARRERREAKRGKQDAPVLETWLF